MAASSVRPPMSVSAKVEKKNTTTWAIVAGIGGRTELAAIAFPLSSPYAMLARAAVEESLWPHLLAIGWQALWVVLFIRGGASLFRRRVMKSGPQGARRRWNLWRSAPLPVAKTGRNTI